MSRRNRILLLAFLGLVVVVGTPSLWAFNYIEHDPRFCTTCHVMGDAFGRWSKSEHSKIECHSCHISGMADNIKRLYYAVVEPKTKVESHADVDRTVCLKCHESLGGKRWQDILATAGHQKHMERAAAQCVDCHSAGVHKFTPPANVCAKCHEKVTVHEGKMAGLECLDCHDFLADRSSGKDLLPRASDCRRCHGVGEERRDLDREKTIAKTSTNTTDRTVVGVAFQITETSVHGSVDCKRCHNPHASKADEMRAGKDCTRCHKGPLLVMKISGPEKHRDCKSCHVPHSERGSATKRCLTCHEGKHTGATETTHAGKCSTCHVPHKFKLEGRVCAGCHVDKALKLDEEGPKKHESCTQCHEPHAAPPRSEACMKCHRTEAKGATTARPDKHRECVSCHDAHAGKPKNDLRCRTCHDKQAGSLVAAQAAGKMTKPQHALCRSCHRTMHGTPEADARSCMTCHAKQGALVQTAATPERHKQCASCHEQHGGAKPDLNRCVKCHESLPIGTNGDPHGTECLKCHQPHGAPGPTKAACRTCHEKVNPIPGRGADKHRDCKSCHQPHRPASRDGSNCVKCHQVQKDSLKAWSNQIDHQKCSSCHIGHDPGHPKPCGTCHEKPAAGLKLSKHTACQNCHRPHQTLVVERKLWWGECARCHAKQVDGAKQRGPTHNRCENCHQPHAFQKPTCDSCHNAIRAQLMHSVSAHQKCGDCHETHAKTGLVRKACLQCHEKQRADHFPEAQRCDACHAFSNANLGRSPADAAKLLEQKK